MLNASQTKTEAYDRYELGPSDLDNILPFPGSSHKYNERDVQVLRDKTVAMIATMHIGAPGGDTVPNRWETITRTRAKEQYK